MIGRGEHRGEAFHGDSLKHRLGWYALQASSRYLFTLVVGAAAASTYISSEGAFHTTIFEA